MLRSGNFAPGFEFSDAEVFVDERLRNQASVDTNGIDFTTSYGWDVQDGELLLTVGGTYLLNQEEKLLPSDDPLDLVDTVGNPADLRLRFGINWSYNRFAANLAISHVGDYTNDNVDPAVGVDSWTTADLVLTYDAGERFGNAFLSNTIVSFNVLNAFDEDPPFIDSIFPGNGINYDPANANALGRTVAVQVTKRW